jgi:hypothetical protein
VIGKRPNSARRAERLADVVDLVAASGAILAAALTVVHRPIVIPLLGLAIGVALSAGWRAWQRHHSRGS